MSRIAVIGGGPAGIMASIFASQNGADVTLFEKNEKLGKKIYITGKGRCNVTNDCEPKEFLSNVVTNANFLYSASFKWSSRDTMDFLEQNGLKLKVERGNRVFPESDKASDVTKTLEKVLRRNGVKICLNSEILAVECYESGIKLHTISDIVSFDKVIIATGGVSYPTTGSTGDGYKFAKTLGHNVVDVKAGLCEIPLRENVASLEGLSLKNVTLTAKNLQTGKELCSFFGEMLFTKNGISGPIALSTSSVINKYPVGQIALYLDLKPGLKNEHGQQPSLDERLLKDFKEFTNKEFKNSLVKLFPDRLAQFVVSQTKICPDKQVNRVSAEERERLRGLIKALPFHPSKPGELFSAIITSGGVDVKQVNPSTMQSKLCQNVYFAGETLDVDAYTGGFNMQIAFATGYLAGVSASKEW